jgi:hypothetical protein
VKNWKYWLRPQLDIFIDIGFLQISTQCMHYAIEQDIKVFLGVSIRLFKWRGTFRWYETGFSKMISDRLSAPKPRQV